jgi:hypothetical protein
MSYTIPYSDPGKNNNPIIVPDVSGNKQSTSLTLIGKNAPGFGQQLAENFVHMLENFASPVAPINTIEGQLWYDNSTQQLKITSGGALWAPVNGVHQQDAAPVNIKEGDLWVDTLNQQLKLWNGAEYILVGPATSGATRTGPYTETFDDQASTGGSDVIVNYSNGFPIAIISSDQLTPSSPPQGFPNQLVSGINLATGAILNGTALIATNLQTTSGVVNGNNFLMKDRAQRIIGSLSVGVDSNAIQIGSNSTFILQRQGESGFISNFSNTYSSTGTNASGRFTFDAQINGQTKTLLTIDGSNQQTTVAGNLSVSGNLNFMPAGTVISYAGSTVPPGWLLCNGATTSTSAHPTLFSIISTTYGSTTSTNFRVPNMTPISVTTGTAIKYIIRT